jgi:predicted RNase H-like HicB family nuclease
MVEKPLVITYDENGEWVVEKAKQTAWHWFGVM